MAVELSHFCDLGVTASASTKFKFGALGFINPSSPKARVTVIHVGCERCKDVYQREEYILKNYERCNKFQNLGDYTHAEQILVRQNSCEEKLVLQPRKMPVFSSELDAHVFSFEVDIEEETCETCACFSLEHSRKLGHL